MGACRGIGGGSGCTSTGTCFLYLPRNICISFSLRLLSLGFASERVGRDFLRWPSPTMASEMEGRTNLGRLSR